ncbi:HlyD family secretion protein [bacterium]|nr:HlyD family secretion protein [bacterium]
MATKSELNRAEMLKLESGYHVQEELFTIQSMQSIRAAVELGSSDAHEQRKRRLRDRDRALLYSPVGGVVLKRHVSNERVLRAGEPLLEIGRLEDLEVGVDILTQDAASIEVGDPVAIEGPAVGNEPLKGSVARINPQGFTKVSSLGVEQQRVLVVVHFERGELAKLTEAGATQQQKMREEIARMIDVRPDMVSSLLRTWMLEDK